MNKGPSLWVRDGYVGLPINKKYPASGLDSNGPPALNTNVLPVLCFPTDPFGKASRNSTYRVELDKSRHQTSDLANHRNRIHKVSSNLFSFLTRVSGRHGGKYVVT